jgi:RNA polymerase sigma-70 factor (ECF subfamily)
MTQAELIGASDTLLVHHAKDGDIDAFEELMHRYDRRTFRIARQITLNEQDAEEVTQDTFLKAYRALGAFEEKAKFSTWLFRIAVNEALMKLRRQKRVSAAVSFDEEFEGHDGRLLPYAVEVVDWHPDAEQLYNRSELNQILVSAVQQLSLRQRTVFLLRDVEGVSTSESAEMLNMNPSTLKADLRRARLKLRHYLARYFSVKNSAQLVITSNKPRQPLMFAASN